MSTSIPSTSYFHPYSTDDQKKRKSMREQERRGKETDAINKHKQIILSADPNNGTKLEKLDILEKSAEIHIRRAEEIKKLQALIFQGQLERNQLVTEIAQLRAYIMMCAAPNPLIAAFKVPSDSDRKTPETDEEIDVGLNATVSECSPNSLNITTSSAFSSEQNSPNATVSSPNLNNSLNSSTVSSISSPSSHEPMMKTTIFRPF